MGKIRLDYGPFTPKFSESVCDSVCERFGITVVYGTIQTDNKLQSQSQTLNFGVNGPLDKKKVINTGWQALTSHALLAISLQFMYHCGFSRGSMTSFERL